MTEYIQMEKRTVFGVLKRKYLDHIEKHGITPTLKKIGVGLLSTFLGIWWSYPDQIIDLFWAIFGAGNFVLLKIFTMLFFIYFAPSLVREIVEKIPEDREEKISTLHGVPTVELINYLFENGNFPRNEFVEKFGITRGQFESILKILDTNNILVRGENNGRVLNENLTREMVVKILEGKDENRYGEIIGKTFNFFSKEPSPTVSRFTKTRLKETA